MASMSAFNRARTLQFRQPKVQEVPRPIHITYRKLRETNEVHTKFDPHRNQATLLRNGYQLLNGKRLTQCMLTFDGHYQKIPRLSHGLEAVVQQSGLYSLKTGDRYNFDSFLATINQPEEINWKAVPAFVTPFRDQRLHRLCLETKAKYKSSTSSMSGVLSHAYYLFSKHKPVNITSLVNFRSQNAFFTPAAVKPVGIVLRPRDGVYSIDRDTGDKSPTNQVLLALGKSLERMLVMSPEEFKRKMLLRYQKGDVYVCEEEECYGFMLINNKFVLRSQFDCMHPDVGVFDLKTRATYGIRMNNDDIRSHVDCRIESVFGKDQSYEREFYDMVRATFLKYIFQARIGDMAGIFVAYHNTREIFGFEYVSRQEMEHYVMSTSTLADASFEASILIVEHILDTITERFPNETLKITLQTTPYSSNPQLTIFVERIPDLASRSLILSTETENKQISTLSSAAYSVANPVYKYVMQLETTINGAVTVGPLKLRDGEWPQVFVKMTEVQQPLQQTIREYKKMLHESAVYSIASLDDLENDEPVGV